MSSLISKNELTNILKENGISEFYVDIDKNGAMLLALAPHYLDKIEQIETKIKTIDNTRTPDDIFNLKDLLHPVKRIVIDDDDDEYTLNRYKEQKFSEDGYSQQLNSWLKKPKKNKKVKFRPPCITFYSYKGGVGRSTALAIVARLIAKEGFKVAVIDLDLEAPGLNSLLLTKSKPSPFGVVDYLYHAPWIRNSLNKQRFLSQYIIREEVPRLNKDSGHIFVMSAGGTVISDESRQLSLLFKEDEVEIMLEPNYLQKLSYVDFDVYARQSTNVFEQLLDDIGEFTEADIILLDARTGFSNISGTLINQFSDGLSIHVQYNRQNREGIEFIANHVSYGKMQNTIWSHTKASKSTTEVDQDLKNYIITTVQQVNNKEEYFPIILNRLPYDSFLEDITSHELKFHIDRDRISLAYKNLTQQIINMTGLDEKLPYFLNNRDRRNIVNDFKNLLKEDSTIYIPRRFLNEDLELFVGFPGSGKTTFGNYMKEKYNEKVEIVSFEEFSEMDTSAHRILSHVIFLDWTYEEATQAVCKWSLQSDVFLKWLKRNEKFSNSDFSLDDMRNKPEYELPIDIAEHILNLVFQNKDNRPSGWNMIFRHLEYRENFVLPKDMILGVKLFIKYFIDKSSRITQRLGTDAIFPGFIGPRSHKKIWSDIGAEKENWLKQYDEKLLALIKSYKKTKYWLEPLEDFIAEQLKEEYTKNADKESFRETLEKALTLDIFSIKRVRNKETLVLSPIYRLI